jgi:proteic killer suppression protein
MIRTFVDKTAQDIYNGINSRYSRKISSELHGKIQRLLDKINAVVEVETLRIPPSNHLERLSGKLKDFWSIRINNQWRIVFRWEKGDAIDVSIIDYH